MYSKAVLLYLFLLQHWEKEFPVVANIWKQNLAAFIEEDGELSFSVLSRTVLADTTKSSFDTMNKAYMGQHMYREAMNDLDQDLHCFTRTASLHTILDPYSHEVFQLTCFLKQHFLSLQEWRFEMYPKLGKGAFGYLPPTETDTSTQRIKLHLDQLLKDSSLGFLINEFEPPSLQHRFDELLNSLDGTLLQKNISGFDVKYIFSPEDLISESSNSSDLEDVL